MRAARAAGEQGEAESLTRAVDDLPASLRVLASVSDLDVLRGIEGEAARGYFQAVNYVIKPPHRTEFAFTGRTRRPLLDPLNALLSFLYSMLANDCRSALESVGLDPQLGFLHAVRPGRAALARDLMEEFWAYSADRIAMTLVNRAQITPDEFEHREGGAVLLNEKGRKALVVAYQERKQEEVQHPLLESKVQIGMLPMIQARLMARNIKLEVDQYLPFMAR